jgi:hypothetical protein
LDDPHCRECGRTLQGVDCQRRDYASVFDGYLLCQVCAHVVNNAIRDNTRRRRADRLATLSPWERQHAEAVRRDRLPLDAKARLLLRSQLMAECPRCWNCGKALQATDPQGDDYANVVLQAGKLACRECVNLVAQMFAAESEARL